MKKIQIALFLFIFCSLLSFVSASPSLNLPGDVSLNVYAYCSGPEYHISSVEVKCEKQNDNDKYPVSISLSEKNYSEKNIEGWGIHCLGGESIGTIILTCCKNESDINDSCECETVVSRVSSRIIHPPLDLVVINRSKEFVISELVLPNKGAKIGNEINIELFDNISHNCKISSITQSNFESDIYSVVCKFEESGYTNGVAYFSISKGITTGSIDLGAQKYIIKYDINTEKVFLQEMINVTTKSKYYECIFENSQSIQTCYFEDYFNLSCSGIKNCRIPIWYWDINLPIEKIYSGSKENISSDVGKDVVLVSSCGNRSMKIGDDIEKIVFDCKEEISPYRQIDCKSDYYPKYLDRPGHFWEKINFYIIKIINWFKK